MKYFILFLGILLFNYQFADAQKKYTISGEIRDAASGEQLIGATLLVKELPKIGTSTNAYGFFSLTIPEGKYTVVVQYVGYEPKIYNINLDQNRKLNAEIKQTISALQEVIVSSEKTNKNVTSTEMSTVKLSTKEMKMIPVLFGEKDILKTIQLLPGIKSAGEGNSGFYVRGGGMDQNLILMDEATVYNSSHLLGFFSIFNSDALKDVNIFKGGMPSEFGGRLSSVLDVKMNDGNDKGWHLSGGIGLIASRLTIEGPIIKDTCSIMISGRRTYVDIVGKGANLIFNIDSNLGKVSLYFYDLNMKINYRLNDKNRLYLSGYLGRDVFGFGDQFGFDWGNKTVTLRWNHLFNEKLFLNSSLIYSDYNYNINISFNTIKATIKSAIQDFNLKEDLQYFLSTNQTLKFGINSMHHTFLPGQVSSTGDLPRVGNLNLDNKYALENAAYISDEISIGALIKMNIGLRFSDFAQIGPSDIFSYNEDGSIKDTTNYNSGDVIKNYIGLEPRFSMSYILDEKSSIKGSYTRTNQYLHLLSNSTAALPTDLWIPSSAIVKPQLADQVALGYFRNFKDNAYEASVEVYYKYMQNQIDYKNGANLILNKYVESLMLFGTGRSYGVELFVKKKFGKLNGWIGYTLSRTERQFDGISNGNVFPAKQDRTHDISVVAIYELNNKWNLSATWVFNTGNAVTFPSGKYELEGNTASYYTERNGYRMPAYHRMDVGVNYLHKKTEKYESSWNFSVYNLYARENVYSISFQQDPSDPTKTQAVQLSLFRIIPSVTWNFKF